MIVRNATDAETWLLSLPPRPRQTRWVVAIAACQVAALALLAPFAKTQLAQVNGFIPAFEGVIFVTDLVTSALVWGYSFAGLSSTPMRADYGTNLVEPYFSSPYPAPERRRSVMGRHR